MKSKTFEPPKILSAKSKYSSIAEYKEEYDLSIKDSDMFWAEKAHRLDWIQQWDKISDVDFAEPRIKWFVNGKMNVSYNCLDRHIANGNGDRVAFHWEETILLNAKLFPIKSCLLR